jgi:anthranilate phosphoribosyltransferase
VTSFEVTPEEVGLSRVPLDALHGGEPAHSAALMRDLLGGAPGALRDIVLLNSAAALVVADRAEDLRAGIVTAAGAIDSGAARQVLDRLVAMTNGGSASG